MPFNVIRPILSGLAVGAANYVARLGHGIKHNTRYEHLAARLSHGAELVANRYEHATQTFPGHGLTERYVGAMLDVIGHGADLHASYDLDTPAARLAAGGAVTRIKWDVESRRGANAQVGSAGDWQNPANAQGFPNGGYATMTGDLLATRSGTIHLTFPDFLDKRDLDVQAVELRLHYAIANTLLGNGNLTWEWRVNGGAWTSLGTQNTNVDQLASPRVVPLPTVTSWADVATVEARVTGSTPILASLPPLQYTVDAAELVVTASLTDNL